jgi:uncharacterized protein (DUF1800 family)
MTAADLLSPDPLLHLLRRATYGPRPAAVAEIRRLGAAAWLDAQLDPASIDDAVADDLVARFPWCAATIPAIRAAAAAKTLKVYDWTPVWQVSFATFARAVWSKRQLLEVMTEFWSNHFNVICPDGDTWDSRADYDAAVLRTYALGSFSDLLKAVVRHPAMLTYLGNRSSTKAAPNENYGRELLELHTVGMPYAESDVRDAARLLTGLTVDNVTGLYRYDPARHAVGAVTVLGFSHPNPSADGGEQAVLALLDYLALHPSTARRIVTKLCVRFVADDPPVSLITSLVKVYLDNRSAIAPVLRALFASPEFAASIGAKTRTPYEDIVATLRTLDYGPEPAGTKAIESLYWTCANAGQAPLAWGPPNGYPDVAAAWVSPASQLVRWNAHLNVGAGYWPATLVRPPSLLAAFAGTPTPVTYGALIDATSLRLLQTTLPDPQREALAGFFGKTTASPVGAKDPAIDWMFPYLMAMLLNSPTFALR